jgi:flagella synthesis protein FlgN
MSPLAEVLSRETDLVSRFILLLKNEQNALKLAQAAALSEINRDKQALIEQLNAVGTERSRLTDLNTATANLGDMSTWLTQHPDEKQSAALWVVLIDLAKEAKTLHELNGTLINLHLKQTADAIAVLTRQHQEHSLYGSNGQAAAASGSRIVDSA